MVFKVIDNNLTTIFNKTQTISNGFNLASNSVNNFVDGFNRLNTQQNFGSRWDSFINGATSANGNMATYFENLAKQGASARASIEGVYDAILDGNTRGIGNVKSVIATFNSLNPANQKAFATAVGQSNVQLGNYLMNLQTGTASMREYAGQVVQTTAKTIGLQVASTALNAVISLGVTAAISGLVILISKGVSALSDLANNVEKTKEKVEELTSEFNTAIEKANSNAKRVEELADRYDELSDGVNNLGENVSLTNEEYEEYNTLVNEIADMFPNLIQGYTDEGNAILNLKGNVEALRDAYKEAQQEAYNLLIVSGKDNDGNDILKQWNDIKQTDFWASLGDFGKADVGGQISVSQALEQLKAIQDMSLEQYKEIKALFNRDDAIGRRLQSEMSQSLPNEVAAVTGTYLEKALGLNGWTTEEEFTEAKKQAKILVQTYNAEVESALQDVKTLANAYLMTNNDYKQLDTQTQNAVSIIVNGLDDGIASGFEDKIDVGQYVSNIVDSISNNDEAQQALTNLFTIDTDNQSVNKIQSDVDKYINIIAQAIGEDSDKLKIRLGFDDIDSELQKAKAKFVEGRFNAKPISDFLENLTLDELNIAMQIPDLFDEGLEGASKKIREWEKNNSITLTVAFDNEEFDEKIEEATKSVSAFTSSQKDLNSALEEQKEHGQLSAGTMQSLIDAGYSEALAIDKVTGAVTLNTEKYKELNNEKKKEIQLEIARLKVDLINPYKEETTAIADLERSLSSLNDEERKATKIKIDNMRANLANSNLTDEQRKQKEQQLADLEAMLASLDAPNFGNSSGSDDDTPDSVKNFEAELAKRQHEINLGLRKEDASYYDWLLSAAHKAYDGLADYEEELWKYEEQVYEWRKDHEQDLFDQKIENLDKEKEKALENNDFSTAKTSVNTQITKTKKRIVELKTSGKQDVDDEIKQLEEDLDNFNDDLKDISSQEYEFKVSVVTDNVDEQIEALDRSIENTGDTNLYSEKIKVYKDGQQQILDMIKFYRKQGYAEDSAIIKELKKQWDEYQDSIYDTYEEHINAQIDAYSDAINDQIDMLNKYKEEQDSQYEKEISALEEKKKALEKQTDELEKQEEIEEKKKALIEAQRNVYKSLRMVYDGNGNWVVKPTQEALDNVEEAKKDLEGVEQEQLIEALENQIDTIKEKQEEFDDSIDKQINGLNDSNDEFERIMTESLETRKTLDAELIKAIMGEEASQEFLNSYNEAQKVKESANTSSANEQTDVQNDTQTNNNDSVKSTGQEILDLLHEAKPTMENLNTLMGKVKETFPSYKNMGSIQSYQPDLQPKTREYKSVVNNINNSPTLNNYFTITGANAEEIAKTVSDTFDTKIIKSFQAFYDGYYQASSKTMYGNK